MRGWGGFKPPTLHQSLPPSSDLRGSVHGSFPANPTKCYPLAAEQCAGQLHRLAGAFLPRTYRILPTSLDLFGFATWIPVLGGRRGVTRESYAPHRAPVTKNRTWISGLNARRASVALLHKGYQMCRVENTGFEPVAVTVQRCCSTIGANSPLAGRCTAQCSPPPLWEG
jgi:hypothetical protein